MAAIGIRSYPYTPDGSRSSGIRLDIFFGFLVVGQENELIVEFDYFVRRMTIDGE